MKRYMLLHVGFEQPTQEIMGRWKAWFASVAPQTVENVGLRAAREVSREGVKDLGWASDSLTGYTIVTAEDMDAAEAMARSNPFITSIRIYELAS
jgi:hypothetical protein